MDRRTLLRGLAVGSTGLLGSLAGCNTLGDDGASGGAIGTETAGTTTASVTTAQATTGTAGTVAVASNDELGDVLVDGSGMTLYLFTRDEGRESTCYGDCEANWPPLVVDGDPTAADGVSAELGTTEREDGSTQVTAAGHPLYRFAGDEEPGETNGQDLGDVWYVVSPAGQKVEAGEGEHETEHEDDHGMDEIPTKPADHADVAMKNMDGGHHFEPHVVRVKPGGTVTWTLESGAHSTTAYHSDNDRPNRTPEGAKSWDSGVLTEQGATFERTFETEGVYDYFCIPHESMGMLGSVIVGDPDPEGEPALAPPQDALPEAARSKIEELNHMVREALGASMAGTTESGAGGTGTTQDPYY